MKCNKDIDGREIYEYYIGGEPQNGDNYIVCIVCIICISIIFKK